MSTEVYAGRECSVTLISPIDGSTLLTVPYVRTLSVQDKIVYARRTAHRSSAISAPVIRANGSVTLTKDAESMAVVNELKRWANGVFSYPLSSNLRGKRYSHPHLRITMTNSDGTVETITAYDIKLSDRSLSRPDGTLSDSITLDALGGIDTPNNDHGDPYKALTLFRTGSATYINTAGTLSTAGDGAARINHDGNAIGLFLEGAGRNNLTYSQTFANAAWTKGTGGAAWAPTDNATSAPDGSATGSQMNWVPGQFIYQGGGTGSASQTVTASVWVKPVSTATQIQIRIDRAGVAQGNQVTKTLTPGQWNRVGLTATLDSGTGQPVMRLDYVNGDVYLWGAQLEDSPFATSYIPTTSATASRSPDLCALTVPHNLLTYSQDFTQSAWSKGTGVTVNGLVSAPDGTNTARSVAFAASSLSLNQVSAVKAASQTFCGSIWVRSPGGTATVRVIVTDVVSQNATISSQTVGTTWQRLQVSGTFTSAATGYAGLSVDTNGAAVTLELWGAQLEQASIPGIYVPTTSQALPKPTDGTEWPSAVQGGWTDFTQNGRVTIKLTAPNASGNFDIFGDSGGSIRVYQVGSQTKVSRTYSGGTTVLTLPASIADGNLHTLVIWWTNQGGSQVLNATVDGGTTTTVAGSGAWTAGERLWGSNGSAFCALQSFVWDIAPLPNGATPAA